MEKWRKPRITKDVNEAWPFNSPRPERTVGDKVKDAAGDIVSRGADIVRREPRITNDVNRAWPFDSPRPRSRGEKVRELVSRGVDLVKRDRSGNESQK